MEEKIDNAVIYLILRCERKWVKTQVAGGFRVFAKLGNADGGTGHISLRGVTGDSGCASALESINGDVVFSPISLLELSVRGSNVVVMHCSQSLVPTKLSPIVRNKWTFEKHFVTVQYSTVQRLN